MKTNKLRGAFGAPTTRKAQPRGSFDHTARVVSPAEPTEAPLSAPDRMQQLLAGYFPKSATSADTARVAAAKKRALSKFKV